MMRTSKTPFLPALGLAMLVLAQVPMAVDAHAQAGAPASPPADALSLSPAEARADREFLARAVQAGLGEVELARLVQARGGMPGLQALAAGLAQEQAPFNEELLRLGDARGLATPAGLDRNHQDTVERLGRLDGPDFGRAYLKQMVDEHQLAITDHERQAAQTKDGLLKDYCLRALPVLRNHLRLAQTALDAAKTMP